MAQLPDIDFSVVIDNSIANSPKISFTDTTPYTDIDGGKDLSDSCIGYFSVRQPDGVTVSGSFDKLDTYPNYLSGLLRDTESGDARLLEDGTTRGINLVNANRVTVSNKELRLDANQEIQKGSYVFKFTVRCIGYDDTTVEKTVVLDYERPLVKLDQSINLFNPYVKVVDNTVYDVAGFASAVTRAFVGTINTANGIVRTVTSNTATLDYKYGNNYYDAKYTCSFSYVNTLTGTSSLNWLVVKDNQSVKIDDFDVYELTDINILFSFLSSEQLILFISGCKDELTVTPNNKGIYDIIVLLDSLYYKYTGKSRVHTNKAISAYNIDGVNYGDGVITITNNTTTYTAPYNLLINKVVVYASTSTNFSIGNTVGSDDIMPSTFVNGNVPYDTNKVMNTGDIIYFTGVNSSVIIKLITTRL